MSFVFISFFMRPVYKVSGQEDMVGGWKAPGQTVRSSIDQHHYRTWINSSFVPLERQWISLIAMWSQKLTNLESFLDNLWSGYQSSHEMLTLQSHGGSVSTHVHIHQVFESIQWYLLWSCVYGWRKKHMMILLFSSWSYEYQKYTCILLGMWCISIGLATGA